MARWSLAVDVGEGGLPVFVRIARAISDDIRRGRLAKGAALPGTRTLASSLGVHRNTVLAAYQDLAAEGWITTENARGTFVSDEIPDVKPRRFSPRAAVPTAMAVRPGFDLPSSPPNANQLEEMLEATQVEPEMSLGGGIPDVRLVPEDELSRAIRRVLRRRARQVLSYGPPEGPHDLRRALAEMLATTRGVLARGENLLVTRGSQMGVDLASRGLLAPGDTVAVESLGYRPAWEAMRAAGLRLVPVRIDAGGLDVDELERLLETENVRAVYVTPHHQFPTTVSLSAPRRLKLLELARAHRFFILEDDYAHEFNYEGRPVLPLASADVHGVVVYLGTLSKVLAPGVRIGFVAATPPVVKRLAAIRRVIDRQGDHLLEQAVADLLEDGSIQRHIRRARRIYADRRETLANHLRARFGDALSFELPSGGTAIWVKVTSPVSVDAWAACALRRGLQLQRAKLFAFDGKSRPFFRLGFAQHDDREMREAVRRMHTAMNDARA